MDSSQTFAAEASTFPSATVQETLQGSRPVLLPGQSILSENGGAVQSTLPSARRRLPRALRACEMCRDRKTKCDQQWPCSHCTYHSLTCVYRPSGVIRRRRRKQESSATTASATAGAAASRSSSDSTTVTNWKQLHSKSKKHDNGPDRPGSPPKASRDVVVEPATPLNGQSQEHLGAIWDMETGVDVSVHEGQVSNIGTPRLGGVNTHTRGTEFYGGSSNLAFLAKLFAKARKRAGSSSGSILTERISSHRTASDMPEDANSETRHLNNDKLSIVNLMYSTDYHSPNDSRPGLELEGSVNSEARVRSPPTPILTPTITRAESRKATSAACDQAPLSLCEREHSVLSTHKQTTDIETRKVEKIFIHDYFTGAHYIHPMLSENAFRAQCAKEIWPHNIDSRFRASLQSPQSQFLALYYAVIALGAINSGIDETSPLTTYYRKVAWSEQSGALKQRSTLDWANIYFTLARQALGDILEISSLESCQALFIMTAFCQNALKPHPCYMYSGMAVRTAIAIGLSNESSSAYIARKEEARRTWWCIRSHEMFDSREMCCSSGRLDSLKPTRQYTLSKPRWKASSHNDDDCHEGADIAIIPVMVELSQILQRVSQDIYDDSGERSISEKSQICFQLHDELDTWKANLPNFLKFETNSLSDSGWAFKQKLVLNMRFLNARIVIHRPFLVASSSRHHSLEFSRHVEICLDAARSTIHLIHDAFKNRIYLRTWWYCTTYTLYASMIILYLVLMGFPKVPGEELIADVEKSLEIFLAMKTIVVARHCAEFTKEMIAVARRYLQDCRQRQPTSTNSLIPTDETMLPDVPLLIPDDQGMCNDDGLWNDSILAAILNQEMPVLDRASALANLYDPNLLEEFTLSGDVFAQEDDDLSIVMMGLNGWP